MIMSFILIMSMIFHLLKLESKLVILEVARPTAPRRQAQSFGSGNVTPISMITPYISKWRICGLCTAKDELKTTKARSGAGDMKVRLVPVLSVLNN